MGGLHKKVFNPLIQSSGRRLSVRDLKIEVYAWA
jgi:hypothetical protein